MKVFERLRVKTKKKEKPKRESDEKKVVMRQRIFLKEWCRLAVVAEKRFKAKGGVVMEVRNSIRSVTTVRIVILY